MNSEHLDEPKASSEHSTIFHLPFSRDDLRESIRYGNGEPDQEQLSDEYDPAETILGTADPAEAYHHAQGFIVNNTQNATHMVRSASPGDVIKTVSESQTEYHLVESIGFTELKFETEPTAQQQASPKSAHS